MMLILEETTYMHWLTLITSKQCSNPDNSSRPWSSTRQPCLSQSNKGSLWILLPKNISNGYECPPHPLRIHGHSPRMVNFSYLRGPSMSLIMQTSDLMFSDPTMII